MSQQKLRKLNKQRMADFHFMIGFLSNDDIKISVYKCHRPFTVSYNELKTLVFSWKMSYKYVYVLLTTSSLISMMTTIEKTEHIIYTY